jgi:uncharacterized membrane protein YgcG
VHKASLQKVQREYELLSFKEGECMQDFAMRLNNLTNQLTTLGDVEPDEKIVDKYLHIEHPRYKQLVISIETLLDFVDLSMEEITRWLKAGEDDIDIGTGGDGDKLYLMKEQWLEKYMQKEATGSHHGGVSGAAIVAKGGRGSGSGGKSTSNKESEAGFKPPMVCSKEKCHNYGKTNHWARDCCSKGKKEQAHVAQDDESSLLLVG